MRPNRAGAQVHLRDVPVLGRWQVVDLVDDEELEAVAEVLGADQGGVVRGDGDGLDVRLAAAQTTDVHAKDLGELGDPLVDEVDGGHDHEGRSSHLAHRFQGDVGLAGGGGEDDDAMAASVHPGPHRLLLVRA